MRPRTAEHGIRRSVEQGPLFRAPVRTSRSICKDARFVTKYEANSRRLTLAINCAVTINCAVNSETLHYESGCYRVDRGTRR